MPLAKALKKDPGRRGLDPYISIIAYYSVQFYAMFLAQKVRGATSATSATRFSIIPII